MIKRIKTKKVYVGNIPVGGNSPISIQSMTNTPTQDAKKTIKQIKALEKVGCQIVRFAVEDLKAVQALPEIRKATKIPLVADIHYNYKLAILSAPYVDKLRINPGNIGSSDKVALVVAAAKKYHLPIRIGINLGSLEKEFEKKYGRNEKAMIASASRHIKILEQHNFKKIIVSLKASDIETTVKACRLFSQKFNYPQHLGITESGTERSGSIKSAIGLGILLHEGIGDTIRVSLSSDPTKEIPVAISILKSLGLKDGLNVVSCPMCSRAGIDTEKYANDIENKLSYLKTSKTVAVMGCVVNGPGEAKDADIAIVGTKKGNILVYKKEKFIKTIKKSEIIKNIKHYLSI